MLKIPTIEGFRGGRKSRDGSFFGLILFPGPVYTLPSSVGLNKSHDHEAEPLGGADPVRKADFNLARGSLRGRVRLFPFLELARSGVHLCSEDPDRRHRRRRRCH